jgi:hypothetical protein
MVGKFKAVTPSDKPIDLQDMLEILKSEDYKIQDGDDGTHETISDKDLEKLLDRSDAAFLDDKDIGTSYKLVSSDTMGAATLTENAEL